MPGYDETGPRGQGPKTGGGFGHCGGSGGRKTGKGAVRGGRRCARRGGRRLSGHGGRQGLGQGDGLLPPAVPEPVAKKEDPGA